MIRKDVHQLLPMVARIGLVMVLMVAVALVCWLNSTGGSNPLMNAVYVGDLEAAQDALLNQPDLIEQTMMSRTALHLSASNNDTAMVRLLLQTGAQIDARDKMGKTPLMIATYNMNTQVAELLMSSGADTKIQDYNGNTVLHHLAFSGHGRVGRKFATLVHANGADPKKRNFNGYQPWQVAESKRKRRLARFLKRQASLMRKTENES